jgi:uncharacterized protein (DUF433 family)
MAEVETTRFEMQNGIPVVGNRRIPVWRIATWHDELGWQPDDIATECGLTLDEVAAAMAYYAEHREACTPPGQTSG